MSIALVALIAWLPVSVASAGLIAWWSRPSDW